MLFCFDEQVYEWRRTSRALCGLPGSDLTRYIDSNSRDRSKRSRKQPRDLDVVLDAKMGDCKDHATLMQALLAAQGIASEQVLVNAGKGYRLPKIVVASTQTGKVGYGSVSAEY